MESRTGLSLHIGLNRLSPDGYPLVPRNPGDPESWEGPLNACERDADDMCRIAESQHFKATVLKTSEATAERVIEEMERAASQLTAGDIFVLSFAGHGGQVPDLSGDEADQADETWCLYDRQLLDDELFALYTNFAPGVRIVIFSDSCHSGTVSRAAPPSSAGALTAEENKDFFGTESPSFRLMPRQTAYAVYDARADFYDELQENVRNTDPEAVKASIRLISACQDDQEAADGPFNGKFTGVVKRIWNRGQFEGNYVQFHAAIVQELETEYEMALSSRGAGGSANAPSFQTPNFKADGAEDSAFDEQRPFSI